MSLLIGIVIFVCLSCAFLAWAIITAPLKHVDKNGKITYVKRGKHV